MSPRGGARKGAGVKPQYGESTVRRSLRIPKSLDDAIRSEAERINISFTNQLIFMLRSYRIPKTGKESGQ